MMCSDEYHQKKDPAMFREHLNLHHYAPVPIPIAYPEFEAAAKLFLNFLEVVPDRKKRGLHFKSPFHRGTANGYNDKRDIGQKDPKEFIHINENFLNEPAVAVCAKAYPDAHAFFERGISIYRTIDAIAVELFEQEFPEIADRVIVDGRLANAYLRFLCYAPKGTHAFNAREHYDKGQGTLALAESSPGLRIGCCREHPLSPVKHESGTALFMPGDLMFTDSKDRIIPAWHDVIVPEDIPPINERCERWSIVFFINDKDGRYSEWDAVHNPLKVHEAA